MRERNLEIMRKSKCKKKKKKINASPLRSGGDISAERRVLEEMKNISVLLDQITPCLARASPACQLQKKKGEGRASLFGFY